MHAGTALTKFENNLSTLIETENHGWDTLLLFLFINHFWAINMGSLNNISFAVLKMF